MSNFKTDTSPRFKKINKYPELLIKNKLCIILKIQFEHHKTQINISINNFENDKKLKQRMFLPVF